MKFIKKNVMYVYFPSVMYLISEFEDVIPSEILDKAREARIQGYGEMDFVELVQTESMEFIDMVEWIVDMAEYDDLLPVEKGILETTNFLEANRENFKTYLKNQKKYKEEIIEIENVYQKEKYLTILAEYYTGCIDLNIPEKFYKDELDMNSFEEYYKVR